jgi:hypothetical protein
VPTLKFLDGKILMTSKIAEERQQALRYFYWASCRDMTPNRA